MASSFWDTQGIIMTDYLEKGKTPTGEYYATFLDQLNKELKIIRQSLAHKKNYASSWQHAHTSPVAMAKLQELRPIPT